MALNFIAFATPPLPIPLLEHAISVQAFPSARGKFEPGDVIRQDTVAELCSSLIRKSQDGLYFEFAHYSVREFLDSEELDPAWDCFRVSEATCARLLAIQCLRYILLDNFNRSPEATIESIVAMAQDNDGHVFYEYASIYWVMYARGEWSNPEVVGLAATLFDPHKTPLFTRWATTVLLLADRVHETRWNASVSRIISTNTKHANRLLETVSEVLDRTFRPLHLAAVLGLPEICTQLLNRSENSTSAANIESPVGTVLQCAVAGFGLLRTIRDFFRWFYQPKWVRSPQLTSHCIAWTVETLLAAGAKCIDCTPIQDGKSLMQSAIETSIDMKDLSVVVLLLVHGATVADEDLETFNLWLEIMADNVEDTVLDRALEPFIMSLNHLANTSPDALALASKLWQALAESGFVRGLTKHTSTLDTRIWIDEDGLLAWAVGTIRCGDLEGMEVLANDPRVSLSSIRTEDGGSLLHLVAANADYLDSEELLACMTRLLDAGASPTVVDDSGKTPFHVWDPYGFEPGTELLEALVRLFIRAGLDINTTDEGGHNVLHANVGKPGQLEAILRTADGEALDRALRATTHRGCTPVMEALRTGEEDGANTLLQFCAERYGFSLEGQDMDIQHLVAESPMSAASIRRVFDLGLCVRLGREESPLHQLQLRYWPSLDCVRALKALFPQSCSTTINEKLPLDKYLNRSITTPFHGSLAQFQTVVQELASLGVQEIEARPLKAAAWDYFTTTVLMLARSTEKEQNGDLVQEVVDAAVRCLITLGYLEAYELTTGKSAVTQMLGFLNPNQLESMADVWPWSSESIALAIEKTHEWTQFDRFRTAPLLLRAAFVSSENRVVQSMLDRGLDLYRTRGARSCLEEIFRLPAAVLDAGKQSLFCILLDHVKPSLLDHLAFASGQLGLIHQPAAGDSAWVMNELMRRGQTPIYKQGQLLGPNPRWFITSIGGGLMAPKPCYTVVLIPRIKMRGEPIPPLPQRHLVAFCSMPSWLLPKNSSRGEWTGNGPARLEPTQA
jgi:hypothetical protein